MLSKCPAAVHIRLKQTIDKYLGYLLIGLLVPFTRLLGLTLFRNHSIQKLPNRILFIKLLGLGSMVVASDAVVAIRKRFPETRLILLTDTNIGAGIAPFHLFDEIHVADTDRFFPALLSFSRFLLASWTWRGLWVIDLEVYSKLTTVLALLTVARNRFGFYLPPVPFRKYLNTHNISFDQSAYLEQNYLYMARVVTGGKRLLLPAVNRRMEEHRKPYILLNNTCSSLAVTRKLPDHTFAALCRWLLEHTPYRLALLGSPSDREELDRFIQVLDGSAERVLNFAGATSDFETYYQFLIQEGVCLITIDSGPLHIARKLGLPTVSIWGPTDPAHYLRIRPEERGRHLSVYRPVPCSPCVHRHETLPCGGDNVCMKDIPASAIIEQVRSLLTMLVVPQPV
jgi:ADP-heptose:LPS heptosyltransferase